jgi:hypothetical protein
MDREAFKAYKARNPYHTWVYREDGTKFVGHFKDKKEAESWAKIGRGVRISEKTTSAAKQRQRRNNNVGFGIGFPIKQKNLWKGWLR